MVNRRTDQPMGLFNFPFFGAAPQPVRLDVNETASELVIEGQFPGYDKEHIKVELIRTGVLIVAEKPAEAPEGEEAEQQQQLPLERVERFVPVNFTFDEGDVTATFSEEEALKIVIAKNDAHRKFISIK